MVTVCAVAGAGLMLRSTVTAPLASRALPVGCWKVTVGRHRILWLPRSEKSSVAAPEVHSAPRVGKEPALQRPPGFTVTPEHTVFTRRRVRFRVALPANDHWVPGSQPILPKMSTGEAVEIL